MAQIGERYSKRMSVTESESPDISLISDFFMETNSIQTRERRSQFSEKKELSPAFLNSKSCPIFKAPRNILPSNISFRDIYTDSIADSKTHMHSRKKKSDEKTFKSKTDLLVSKNLNRVSFPEDMYIKTHEYSEFQAEVPTQFNEGKMNLYTRKNLLDRSISKNDGNFSPVFSRGMLSLSTADKTTASNDDQGMPPLFLKNKKHFSLDSFSSKFPSISSSSSSTISSLQPKSTPSTNQDDSLVYGSFHIIIFYIFWAYLCPSLFTQPHTLEKKFCGYLIGHDGPIRMGCFSSEGNFIASCANDSTVRIWLTNFLWNRSSKRIFYYWYRFIRFWIDMAIQNRKCGLSRSLLDFLLSFLFNHSRFFSPHLKKRLFFSSNQTNLIFI